MLIPIKGKQAMVPLVCATARKEASHIHSHKKHIRACAYYPDFLVRVKKTFSNFIFYFDTTAVVVLHTTESECEYTAS